MTACVSKFGATFSCAAVRGTRIKARGQFSRPALDCLCISFARSHLRSTFRRSLCRTSETIKPSATLICELTYLRSFVVGIPLIAEYAISLPLTTLFLFRLRLAHRHSPSSQISSSLPAMSLLFRRYLASATPKASMCVTSMAASRETS